MPRKKFNVLAIPALLLVLSGISLALFGNNAWLVAGLLLLGVLFAFLSIGHIRNREQRGKGFAVMALVLGSIAMVLTALSIARTEF